MIDEAYRQLKRKTKALKAQLADQERQLKELNEAWSLQKERAAAEAVINLRADLLAKWKRRNQMHPEDSKDQRFYDGFAAGLEFAIKDLETVTKTKSIERVEAEASHGKWRQLAREQNEALMFAQVGSCSCLTKTPDPQYHDDGCVYKRIGAALARYDEAVKEEQQP